VRKFELPRSTGTPTTTSMITYAHPRAKSEALCDRTHPTHPRSRIYMTSR
jgi:hypothetical protein